jgi:hypothetical protein
MLAWILNMGFAAGGGQAPPPPTPPTVLPGGSSRRRGSVWEPSVAFAIAAARAEREAWYEAQKPTVGKSHHPAAKAAKAPAKPVDRRAEVLFLTLEAVQLAIKRAETKWLRDALRRVEREEQEKLAALAREEIEAAQTIMTILMGRREPIGDEEAAAILMNMLMSVKH